MVWLLSKESKVRRTNHAARPKPPVFDWRLTYRLLIRLSMLLRLERSSQAMDREQENNQGPVNSDSKRPGRSWTERFTGPLRYRRYTDKDGGGRPAILFKFELGPGQADLPQAVYDLLQSLKYLDRGVNHGG